jgi:hypothetical protein
MASKESQGQLKLQAHRHQRQNQHHFFWIPQVSHTYLHRTGHKQLHLHQATKVI